MWLWGAASQPSTFSSVSDDYSSFSLTCFGFSVDNILLKMARRLISMRPMRRWSLMIRCIICVSTSLSRRWGKYWATTLSRLSLSLRSSCLLFTSYIFTSFTRSSYKFTGLVILMKIGLWTYNNYPVWKLHFMSTLNVIWYHMYASLCGTVYL